MAAHTQRQAPRTGGRPRVLLAMIEAGGGHKAAARALQTELENAFPDRFDIVTLDFMKAVGEVRLDRRHKQSWSWLLRHPRVSYLSQRVLDGAVPQAVTNAVQDAMLASFSRLAWAYVDDHAIDLAVAVHFMPLRAMAAAARRRVPVLGVDTELLDGNALWAERRMDELMVATETCRAELQARGVPGDRLTVTGYPLHPKFLAVDRDAGAMRHRLGLDPARPTVVHVVGGEGLGGQLEPTAAAVARAPGDLQYVAVCGGNEPLRRRLQALAERAPGGRIRVEGFVDNLHEYIVASDVVVGKAGPAVTVEALVLGRPLVHTGFASASEKRNVDFCVEHGVGRLRTDPAAIVAALHDLAGDLGRLRALQRRAHEVAPRVGTGAIARRIAERLGVAAQAEPHTTPHPT